MCFTDFHEALSWALLYFFGSFSASFVSCTSFPTPTVCSLSLFPGTLLISGLLISLPYMLVPCPGLSLGVQTPTYNGLLHISTQVFNECLRLQYLCNWIPLRIYILKSCISRIHPLPFQWMTVGPVAAVQAKTLSHCWWASCALPPIHQQVL